MGLTSSTYLISLILLLTIYYLIPKKIQWFVLLVFSIIFISFASNSWIVYLMILYGIGVTFFGAIFIENAKTDKRKNIYKILTILMVLAQLIALKYLDFFVITINGVSQIFGKNANLNHISMVAPIGISFYSLISMGYVIDVSRKTVKARKNIFKYMLYVLYFPQITSGPITRYSDMDNKLFEGHEFRFRNIVFGFQRIIWGFFKKLVITERVAIVVNTIFDNYTSYSGGYIIFGMICFAIQLYTDFSGCMDIVLGSSETLGIVLPENFETPFFSKSVSEYWRRWHITLGTWFKDYYFYPILKSNFIQNMTKKLKPIVGKKWSKKIPTYIGMFALWATIGLWHGGNYTYLIGSGILHWFYMTFGEIFKPLFKKIAKTLKMNEEWPVYKLMQMIRTSLLVCIGFVFFRSSTVSQAVHMLGSIFVANWSMNIMTLGATKYDYLVLIFSVVLLIFVDILKTKYDIRKSIANQVVVFQYCIWICLIVGILLFGLYGAGYDSSSFIYSKF